MGIGGDAAAVDSHGTPLASHGCRAFAPYPDETPHSKIQASLHLRIRNFIWVHCSLLTHIFREILWNEICINVAILICFMTQNIELKVYVCLDSLYNQFSQCTSHLGNCLCSVFSMDNQLHQHGIVVCRYSVVIVNMRVNTDSIASRHVNICDQTRTRHEVLFRVLGIDSALNGMARNLYIFLGYA